MVQMRGEPPNIEFYTVSVTLREVWYGQRFSYITYRSMN